MLFFTLVCQVFPARARRALLARARRRRGRRRLPPGDLLGLLRERHRVRLRRRLSRPRQHLAFARRLRGARARVHPPRARPERARPGFRMHTIWLVSVGTTLGQLGLQPDPAAARARAQGARIAVTRCAGGAQRPAERDSGTCASPSWRGRARHLVLPARPPPSGEPHAGWRRAHEAREVREDVIAEAVDGVGSPPSRGRESRLPGDVHVHERAVDDHDHDYDYGLRPRW